MAPPARYQAQFAICRLDPATQRLLHSYRTTDNPTDDIMVNPKVFAILVAMAGIVTADVSVTVHHDATYTLPNSQGLICSGTGDIPVGTACPVKGDVASSNCLPSLSSFNGSACVAPADAECTSTSNEGWSCVFPDRDLRPSGERQLLSKVTKRAASNTSKVVKTSPTKASKAKPRTFKPVKKKGIHNDDSEDCARTKQTPTTVPSTTQAPTTQPPTTQTPTTQPPTTVPPTTEVPTTVTPTRGPSPCTDSGPNKVDSVGWWPESYYMSVHFPSFKSCCEACWADLGCTGFTHGGMSCSLTNVNISPIRATPGYSSGSINPLPLVN